MVSDAAGREADVGVGREHVPQVYEICIRGELSDVLVRELGGTRRSPSTTVVVPTVDRSELHGVIRRLEDLGLELLSIHELSDRSAGWRTASQSPDPGDAHHPMDADDRDRPNDADQGEETD